MFVMKAIFWAQLAFSQQSENVVELTEEELEIVENIEFFMLYENIENESSQEGMKTPAPHDNSQGSEK